MGVFPDAPLQGGLVADLGIGVEEKSRVSINEGCVAKIFRDRGGEAAPLLGEQAADAAGDPFDFALRGGGDESEEETSDLLRVSVGVGQAEGRAPGESENEPAINAEVLAEMFDIGDEVRGGVGGEVSVRFFRERSAASAAPLIEEDDAEEMGIEEATLIWGTASAGSAVEEEGGEALGVTAAFPIDLMPVSHGEESGLIRLDGWELTCHDGGLR